MTAPMPETMSPREKVGPSLNDLLRQAVETMESWTPEQREAHFEAQKKAWVAAEMAFGDEGTRVVTSSAEAISSSGDHAELAKAIERLLPISIRETPDYAEVAFGECQAQAMTMEPETWLALNQLPALVAENAALRDSIGRHDRQVAGMLRARLAAEGRATEAERKLAEAVGLLTELEQHVRAASDGRGHARAGIKSADAARTFLSKEAERG